MNYEDKEMLSKQLSEVSYKIRNQPFKGFQIEDYNNDIILRMKVGEKIVEFTLMFKPEENLTDYDRQIRVSVSEDEDKWL